MSDNQFRYYTDEEREKAALEMQAFLETSAWAMLAGMTGNSIRACEGQVFGVQAHKLEEKAVVAAVAKAQGLDAVSKKVERILCRGVEHDGEE